ncbi:MAG: BsuPI-related putative proteinase inhibitor [Actinomycetota bacterium]
MRRTAALVALFALAAACSSSEVTGNRRVVGGVSMSFSVAPARVEVGTAIRFTLRLTNATGKGEKLTFPTGQHYDFWVQEGGEEVWRWSADRVFTQEITNDEIEPQGTLVLTETWAPERTGTFDVFGEVSADGYKRPLAGELVVR